MAEQKRLSRSIRWLERSYRCTIVALATPMDAPEHRRVLPELMKGNKSSARSPMVRLSLLCCVCAPTGETDRLRRRCVCDQSGAYG